MAQIDIGQIVADAYAESLTRPDTRVVLEAKDGRRWATWINYVGKTLELPVKYRTRYQRAIFDLSDRMLVTVGYDYPLYVQRRGRSQTRLAYVPSNWTPADHLTIEQPMRGTPTLEQRPQQSLFTSDALEDLLK